MRFERRPGDEARLLWLLAAFLAAGGWAAFRLHYEPAISAAAQAGATYAQRTLANRRLLLEAAGLRERERAAERALRDASPAGAGTAAASALIAQAGELARRNRVEIVAVQPIPSDAATPQVEAGALHAASFELRLHGHFSALVRFVGALSHGKAPVSVDAVEMRALNAALPSPALECDLRLRTYRLEKGA